MRFVRLLDGELLRVVEIHVDRAHVERELREITNDEPDRVDRDSIAALGFCGAEPRVEVIRHLGSDTP